MPSIESTSSIPSLSWNTISETSRQRIYRWTGSTGVGCFIGTYLATYDPSFLGTAFLLSLGGGSTSAIVGGLYGYESVPETRFINGLKSRKELEQQYSEMQQQSLFIAAHTTNLDLLPSQIEEINYSQHHPLVDAFEQLNRSEKQLAKMEGKARDLSIQHDQLLPQVPAHFQVPNDQQLIIAVKASRLQLQNAMVAIKRVPDWFTRVTSYNQEKTKEAAETARTMATVAAAASIMNLAHNVSHTHKH